MQTLWQAKVQVLLQEKERARPRSRKARPRISHKLLDNKGIVPNGLKMDHVAVVTHVLLLIRRIVPVLDAAAEAHLKAGRAGLPVGLGDNLPHGHPVALQNADPSHVVSPLLGSQTDQCVRLI